MDHENRNTASQQLQLPQASGNVLATAIGLLACLVAFAAGYITTEMGQDALKAAAASRYFPPIDIFACSIIASLFTVVAAGRFPVFQQYYCPAFFIMLASSSVADFILLHRPLGWLVYAPCVVYLMMYVILYNPLSAKIHQLFTHIRNRAQLLWNPDAVAEIRMSTMEE